MIEKSSEKSQRPNVSLTARADFLTNINSYISYFDKSENLSQRSKQKMLSKHFVRNDGKGTQFLRKELEIALNDSKSLKKHADSLQLKVSDMNKMNKHLMRELGDVRGREQSYQQVVIYFMYVKI